MLHLVHFQFYDDFGFNFLRFFRVASFWLEMFGEKSAMFRHEP